MGYNDYGLTREDVIKLKKICRQADKETFNAIEKAAFQSNPDIKTELAISLKYAKSYEKLIYSGFSVAGYASVDFYAYRRKTLAILKGVLDSDDF